MIGGSDRSDVLADDPDLRADRPDVLDDWPARLGIGRHVSTGHLPPRHRVSELVAQAHERYRTNVDGANSTVYPALADADPDLFGICLAQADGRLHLAGDVEAPFTIMSVAKPFVFALVCEAIGPAASRRLLGVNATGRPFNSLGAVEYGGTGLTNPMVNSGAMAAAGLLPGDTIEQKWAMLQAGLGRFAGRPLELDEGVLASATATNHRNRSLAWLLHSVGRLYGEPSAVLDLYTRQSCLRVTVRDLAVMGATLGNGGVNPITRHRVISAEACRYTLAVMTVAGLYETSGDWLYTVGLPAKSGIGGGIVTSFPGKGGLATYAPRLDGYGNSVKGQLAAAFLSAQLALNLFDSRAGG